MIVRKKPQMLVVAGAAALAFATTMMKFHNDFLTGFGFGVGLPLLAAAVYAGKKSR